MISSNLPKRHTLKLTAIDVLLDGALNGTLVGLVDGLGLEAGGGQAGLVHGALERITLPAKEVITVSAETLVVIEAPDERLRAISGPERLVVESGGVPHGLVGNLGHADGVSGWASTGVDEASLYGVVHMVLVVGAVEILAVPARGEVVDGHDTSWAWLGGEVVGLCASGHDVLKASVAKTGALVLAVGWAANSHAETLKELLVLHQTIILMISNVLA